MVQIIHLGFHKTGTTGLQRLVFANAGLPFYGPREINRNGMLAFIAGQSVPEFEHFRSQPCILSNEASLLRLGGLSQASNIAKAIALRFSDPVVLLTVREQVGLLQSAYFQSEGVRQRAIGFRSGEPLHTTPTRFMSFARWWSLLSQTPERSLAGLLRYRELLQPFKEALPAARIVVLRLEWLRDSPQRYLSDLVNLGFPKQLCADFIAHPPVNPGSTSKLRRSWHGRSQQMLLHSTRQKIAAYYSDQPY